MKRMSAKYAGKCNSCDQSIERGDRIIYHGRGRGASHENCEVTRLTRDQCTACSGSGRTWKNAPCPQCDGTGSRKTQDFAKAGGHPRRHDPPRFDRFHEIIAKRGTSLCINGDHEIKIGDVVGYARRGGDSYVCCAECWRQWCAENQAADFDEMQYASGY